MTEAHQAVMDNFGRKRKIIAKFYATKKPAVKLGGPCDWCTRFMEFELHICLNCGRKLD